LADESVASSSDGISSSSSRRSTIARRISRRIGDVTGLEMNTAESLQVTPSPEQFSSIHTGAFIASLGSGEQPPTFLPVLQMVSCCRRTVLRHAHSDVHKGGRLV